ncbi:hypothetical protein Q2T41_09305 [Maribacter confluentis]|uniref:DNA binding HTH domain-containing protein n=1 Tax=Maribacter confluentis TaxID=1656093 RepID=A0ABT8RPT5_9FLAO|nr:hypothetical protein [Maribacter confluentis]MDO1512850.1 hypothetical protein [Maribacter confluentis]
MKGLQEIKRAIDHYVETNNKTALEVVAALEKHYFNKAVTEEIKLYKKKKKKVAQITKDLKISHRRFYKILEDKKVAFTKYNKSNDNTDDQ